MVIRFIANVRNDKEHIRPSIHLKWIHTISEYVKLEMFFFINLYHLFANYGPIYNHLKWNKLIDSAYMMSSTIPEFHTSYTNDDLNLGHFLTRSKPNPKQRLELIYDTMVTSFV